MYKLGEIINHHSFVRISNNSIRLAIVVTCATTDQRMTCRVRRLAWSIQKARVERTKKSSTEHYVARHGVSGTNATTPHISKCKLENFVLAGKGLDNTDLRDGLLRNYAIQQCQAAVSEWGEKKNRVEGNVLQFRHLV